MEFRCPPRRGLGPFFERNELAGKDGRVERGGERFNVGGLAQRRRNLALHGFGAGELTDDVVQRDREGRGRW